MGIVPSYERAFPNERQYSSLGQTVAELAQHDEFRQLATSLARFFDYHAEYQKTKQQHRKDRHKENKNERHLQRERDRWDKQRRKDEEIKLKVTAHAQRGIEIQMEDNFWFCTS